jgi:hypothetical protein
MFLLINEMGKNQNLRIDITTGFKLLYSDEIQSEGNKLPLRILCLAPAGNLVSQYYQTIDSSMKNGEQPRQSYEKHNLISSVLLVKFGETMIILGGDAEKTSWDYILDDELRISEEGASLHADLVKGLTDGLWGKFTAKRKCHAVIAPFRSRGLPEKEVVRFITEYTKKVFSTALDSCSVSNEISRCSFSFDAVGNCTGTDFEGSAGRISIGEEP